MGDAARKRARKISLRTVERLSVYRRMLEELSREGVQSIHSGRLAELVEVTPAQLRRDLAAFGSFGNVARGYDVRRTAETISEIIGTHEVQSIALVGVGNLGRALLSYGGFEERGFHISVTFDSDPQKTGRTFAGRRCHSLDEMETVLRDGDVRILILATKPEGLQEIVDRAAAAGVRGFLNFVPKMTATPAGCFIEAIDISAKLKKLSFLSRQDYDRTVERPPEIGGGAMQDKRILVVDDDRDLVASIEAFLSARGFLVSTANNGKEAYASIVKERPDLIILDVMMDYEEEGMVLAGALKTDGPTRDIPILMLSGFNVQQDVRDKVIASLMGQDLPAETFMQKPVRLADLAERIESLLGGGELERSPWPPEKG